MFNTEVIKVPYFFGTYICVIWKIHSDTSQAFALPEMTLALPGMHCTCVWGEWVSRPVIFCSWNLLNLLHLSLHLPHLLSSSSLVCVFIVVPKSTSYISQIVNFMVFILNLLATFDINDHISKLSFGSKIIIFSFFIYNSIILSVSWFLLPLLFKLILFNF